MFDVQQTTAGDWAVVAAGARALIVEGQDATALRGLAAAVSSGFAETLEALAADGFARTPSFGLIEGATGRAMIAVRGPVTATVHTHEGERSIDADGVSTWLEQQVAEATSVTLAVTGMADGAASRPALPLADGIVWAAGVSWGGQTAAQAAVPVAAPEAKRAPITAPVLVEAPAEPEQQPEPEPVLVPQAEPEVEAGETRIPDATLSEVTHTDAAEADATGYDHLFGATMMRSVEDAAVRPAEEAEPARIDLPRFITDSAPARPSAEAGDHDGLTIMSGSLDGLRAQDSAQHTAADGAQDAQPPAAPSPRFFVDLADGRREYLEPPIVVGRAPVASTTARGPAPRPVTVDSAERDISRSHTTIAVEGDTVVVTDLHSRNGTMIVLPGKPPQKLRSGEPTAVIAGTVVDLGSGVTLTVGEDA
ncbi:FHA domain-containing protein [Leifsonia sp. Le1]|uniref:FHA domain-containing protein n=1 Tax=Leifsonia sp. Le1 TaxID=3404918 RepID=UPI003EB88F90